MRLRRSTEDWERLAEAALRECRELNELVDTYRNPPHDCLLGGCGRPGPGRPKKPAPPLPDPGTGGWPRRAAAKAELAHYRWVASKLRLQAYDVGALDPAAP